MKVVHVVRQFHPSVGGMEEVVLNVARQHLQQGGETEVLTLDRLFTQPQSRLEARDEIDGVPIQRIAYRGSSRYPLAPAVLRHLHTADLVHVHGIDFFYDFLAAARPLHRKPMVVSTHGGFFHTAYASRLKQAWFQTLTRASARAYARVIATSENDGRLFSRIVPASRLRVIENGVDVAKFAGRGSAVPGRTLVYFGRWSVNKGLLETLDLLAALRHRDPRWRLLLAGREYDFDQAALRDAIQARGLAEHVELVPSPSPTQLAALLTQAQYFVCLSRHEGFGIAAVEAMSAGLQPILSDIPPFARLHRESGLGVLVQPAASEAAAAKVQQLAEASDGEWDPLRERAMAFAARYDWRHIARQYQDEYRAALAPRGATEVA